MPQHNREGETKSLMRLQVETVGARCCCCLPLLPANKTLGSHPSGKSTPLAPALFSPSPSIAALQPSQPRCPTSSIHAPQPLIPLARARAGAALDHRSLVFDRRPMQVLAAPLGDAHPSSLSRPLLQPGPSRCDVSHRSMAPRPPRCPPKTAIDVSRPRHQTNVTATVFVGAARQTREARCRAQPSRCSLASIRWFRHTAGV
jgi:hypothetical protein